MALLQLQSDGLTGHLAYFWADIQHSVWIGGNADGGLHERAPYWLNGLVPLAFLLKSANAAAAAVASKDAPLCAANTDMMYGDLYQVL